MRAFKTIGIVCKRDDSRLVSTVRRLIDHLSTKGCEVLVDDIGGQLLGIVGVPLETFAQRVDLAIVVGGDGTLLHAGRFMANHEIPVLGVNLGRLGFLVDISPEDVEMILEQVLAGKYYEEKRTLLKASVFRGEQCLGENDALNDVVIHVRNEVRMIEFTTHINDAFVNTQRADGMVVATPTGSTAYSLSGGGPILHPDLDAVVLVPICPHTLSHRPIAISADNKIKISLCDQRNSEARVSFDGQSHIDITPGDHLVIQQKQKNLCLLHPENYDYYHILRTKLRWSMQP
ncbi:MAG: NAD kinase (EC [uncultured Thiotrichaceae bacterium]|uniref:NAD kinase n=1 Tax=uncultured Thiotrichaceae bacterium TaxID=298394 RepID=A0A6S6T748_9GAMM|nr:MAG: NAD kinase (EC [uncultured Thiotrichaceae bacterium]